MGKRSSFERNPRDFYPTPYEAVAALLPHLTPEDDGFIEPCAGDGALIEHLAASVRCLAGYDIEPLAADIEQADALTYNFVKGRTFITNPPWDRKVLHPLIERLSDRGRTWLLFDADWIHTKQAAPFMRRLRMVVSVGRVKWIKDSPTTGKDNAAWFCFSAPSDEPTILVGRAA